MASWKSVVLAVAVICVIASLSQATSSAYTDAELDLEPSATVPGIVEPGGEPVGVPSTEPPVAPIGEPSVAAPVEANPETVPLEPMATPPVETPSETPEAGPQEPVVEVVPVVSPPVEAPLSEPSPPEQEPEEPSAPEQEPVVSEPVVPQEQPMVSPASIPTAPVTVPAPVLVPSGSCSLPKPYVYTSGEGDGASVDQSQWKCVNSEWTWQGDLSISEGYHLALYHPISIHGSLHLAKGSKIQINAPKVAVKADNGGCFISASPKINIQFTNFDKRFDSFREKNDGEYYKYTMLTQTGAACPINLDSSSSFSISTTQRGCRKVDVIQTSSSSPSMMQIKLRTDPHKCNVILGLAIGIPLGVLFIIALILIYCCCCKRRKDSVNGGFPSVSPHSPLLRR